jgi:predicted ATPase/class 3 adenylate cyclase/DNA-binding CsgD family transcriptional regulator
MSGSQNTTPGVGPTRPAVIPRERYPAGMHGTVKGDRSPVNDGSHYIGRPPPAGTVTLLLADVEGASRLWDADPDEMISVVAVLDKAVCDIVATHHGVRPCEQGEHDSFMAAFAHHNDALACAVELQRAPLGPIRLRIGLHTGEVQLRGDADYVGPTVNRTAHLRDLAHGGQILLSGTTHDVAVDRLPPGVWLTDLGRRRLPDHPRPERVVQLCHPDLRNEFPPLHNVNGVACERFSVPMTRFVGRDAEIREVRQILGHNRLVTLTGSGGAGKTRLAVQVATRLSGEFCEGVSCVDLAPVTDLKLVQAATARALGVPDQPGQSTMDTLKRFIGDRQMLIVVDNCEHLLDGCASLIAALLATCAGLTVLATSREPLGVPGEVTWRVPSLSLADEAIDLFAERARMVQPDFVLSDDNAAAVGEICRRLDGIPLAIELAAARVRALSLDEILDSLSDRFRLLTDGGRTVVRRHQTLRASADWSHELLSEPERILFRRLAVFMGGFDLDAAQAVGATRAPDRGQVRDQLTMLVDKSLAAAENNGCRTRYRLQETVRVYALEKLSESGEETAVRTRHRDHYTSLAAGLDSPPRADHEQLLERVDTEIDNLGAAFAFSRDNADHDLALQIASSLLSLWLTRGRVSEGLAWFDGVFDEQSAQRAEVAPAVWALAVADRATLAASRTIYEKADEVKQALTIARQVGDPALLVRALIACGSIVSYDVEAARPYFAEAMEIARALGDPLTLCTILAWQAFAAHTAGDPVATQAAAEEGRDLADAIGDRFHSRQCRWCLGLADMMKGDLINAIARFRAMADEADAAHDLLFSWCSRIKLGHVLAYHGETRLAWVTGEAAVDAAAQLGGSYDGFSYAVLAVAALAAGDVAAAAEASQSTVPPLRTRPEGASYYANPLAQVAMARGDLAAARRWADVAVSTTIGWHLAAALTTRARVAIAQRDFELAERDARAGLACAAEVQAHLAVPDLLECLAGLAADAGSLREAARLFGSADGMRKRTGLVRFKVWDAGYEAAMAALCNAMDDTDFDSAWAEGAALSTNEAIAYALRGHTGRKRPASGWASLTPTERDVVRLVAEGLTNKDVAARLFISPRTVQTHLTHIYTKLGVTSRVELAQKSASHV